MRRQVRISQWVSRALVAAMILTAIPLPGYAGEPPAPASAEASLTGVGQAGRSGDGARQGSRAGRCHPVGKTDVGSPSFFKKPVGIAVLAVFAAGIGYAIYSTKHDRIHSAGEEVGGR